MALRLPVPFSCFAPLSSSSMHPPPSCFLFADDEERVRCMPELPALALLLGAASRHLNMRPLSMPTLEVRDTHARAPTHATAAYTACSFIHAFVLVPSVLSRCSLLALAAGHDPAAARARG